MKKRNKWILAGLVTLGITGAVVAKPAHFMSHDPLERADFFAERISNKLELNSSQNAQLEVLKTTLLAKANLIKDQRRTTKSDIKALFGDQFEQQKALELLQAKTDFVASNAPEVISAFSGLYDSLDPQQRAEVKAMIEHRRGRHGHRNHRDAEDYRLQNQPNHQQYNG